MTLHDLTAGDVCGTLLTAGGFHVVFRTAGNRLPRFEGWMQWVWISVFLATVGSEFFEARNGNDVLAAIISAWLLAGLAGATTAVFLPPVVAIWEGWKDRDFRRAVAHLARQRADREEERRERQQAWAKAHQAYLESRPKPRPPPPPPTAAQREAAANVRFQTRCRRFQTAGLTGYELEAAIEQAKQQFLRELYEIDP
jgi:hypothetical protein